MTEPMMALTGWYVAGALFTLWNLWSAAVGLIYRHGRFAVFVVWLLFALMWPVFWTVCAVRWIRLVKRGQEEEPCQQ